jgi:hypothetical protein
MNESDRGEDRRDIWYKLRSIGGISTAIVVAIISVIGSIFLSYQQEKSNSIQLYSQLMSEQARAENAVRKDMFAQILTSFLQQGDQDKKEDDTDCVTVKIHRQILELEMLARNFHETLDIRPLFNHVLLAIVRDMPRELRFTDNELQSPEQIDECKHKALGRLLRKDEFIKADVDQRRKMAKGYIKKMRARRKDDLIHIAKRITKKQLESLHDVEKRIRFKVTLANTCEDIRPTEPLDDKECDKPGTKKTRTLILGDKHGSTRIFTIASNRSYGDWNQVRIKVTTNKDEKEMQADPDGEDHMTAKFWLGFFDFPLVDNTYLSNRERYAVILDDINETEAKVSLLYFPATYAGFKEKSYYQQRIMSTLLKESSAAADM